MKYIIITAALLFAASCASTMESSLHRLISVELSTHPGAGIQDIYKLLYQGEFGVGHIIASRDGAVSYLNEELAAMPKLAGESLTEPAAKTGP